MSWYYTHHAIQPEPPLPPRQPRLRPSHRILAPGARRTPCRRSLAAQCSSLSIPSRRTVRAFGLRRCGSAYRFLRRSAWSASLALPAFLLVCPLLTSRRYAAPVTQRPASIRRSTGEPSRSDTKRSSRRRRIYQVHPHRRWRASRSRARSPRMHHASYPVFVHRPAILPWASSRLRLAATLLPFG
jgi:hypothetical protein